MKSGTLCKPSLVLTAVLCLLAAILSVGLIPRPASAVISSHEWLGAAYSGTEDPYFYGQNVAAYQAGTTAKLVATVVNTTGHDISIDYGRLKLGWSTVVEEADSRPLTIARGEYAIFEWVFTVPEVATASNLILHTYEITVQYDETDGDSDEKWTEEGSKLVVYSADQAACRDSINKWDANNEAYTFWGYEGRETMTEALYLYNKAEDQYAGGDFSDANESYAQAVTMQEGAIEADAGKALTDQTAETLEGTGGTKGIGYLIAGIGLLLAGIGVMLGALLWAIKGGKKPA